MKRGQLTLEYLIILVIMVLLFTNISMDMIDYSLKETLELQTGEMVRAADSLLGSSVMSIELQGSGAKRTVFLRAPSDCDYTVNPKNIMLVCDPGSPSYDKHNGKTFAVIDASLSITYACVTCTGSTIESGKLETVNISKP